MMIRSGAQWSGISSALLLRMVAHVKSGEAEFKVKPSRIKTLLRSRNLISELLS